MHGTVNPLYYLPQTIIFVIGTIVFGIFVNILQKEVQQHGWTVTPRLVCFICFCCSSLLFCIQQLDPYGCLGLFSLGWTLFLSWFDLSLLVNSICAAMYLYVGVAYKQNMATVPQLLTRGWLLTNGVATVLVFILTLIGALTNMIFWFGACAGILVIQEISIMVGFSLSIHRVFQVMNTMKEANKKSYRKLCVIRAAVIILFPIAIVNQMFGSESLITRLTQWGEPVPTWEFDDFDATVMVPDLLNLLAHIVLMYGFVRSSREEVYKGPLQRLSKRSTGKEASNSSEVSHTSEMITVSVVEQP